MRLPLLLKCFGCRFCCAFVFPFIVVWYVYLNQIGHFPACWMCYLWAILLFMVDAYIFGCIFFNGKAVQSILHVYVYILHIPLYIYHALNYKTKHTTIKWLIDVERSIYICTMHKVKYAGTAIFTVYNIGCRWEWKWHSPIPRIIYEKNTHTHKRFKNHSKLFLHHIVMLTKILATSIIYFINNY